MYLQFHIPPKLAHKLLRIIEDYDAVEQSYPTAGVFEPFRLKTPDWVELTLTTRNAWGVCLSPPTLWYDGSRAGFHALTPFREARPRVYATLDEGWLDFYFPDEQKSYSLIPAVISSTNPALRWWERVEELHEQPGRAVVYSPHGHAERVIPYRNVYRSR